MNIRRRAALAAAVLSCAAGVSLGAQQAPDDVGRLVGRPVAAIRFEVEGRPVSSAELSSYVPIRPGDPLRLESVRDAETHLVAAGRYDDVQIAFTESAAGIDLLFRLTPRHPIDRLEFKGETGLPAEELSRMIRERYSGLPAREQPQTVAQVLVALLRDEGFPSATVEPQVEISHNPDRATLILTVTAGSRPAIVSTQVSGQSPLTVDEIIARTGTAAGRPFRRTDLETKLAALEDDLRKEGYFRAVALLPNEPIAEPSGGLMVSLLVEAGPKVELAWDPPDGKPPGDPENFVPMRRQRSVDDDLLEDSDERVASYWKRQGYKDAVVKHERGERAGTLVVTMKVSRGLRHTVQSVRIGGNAHLTEATVRQLLDVPAGASYDEARVLSGIARLKTEYLRLGYHRVDIREEDIEHVASQQTAAVVPVVVPVTIQEGPQARIGNLTFSGASAAHEAALRRLPLASRPGAFYVREFLLRDRDLVETYYRNVGFENVEIRLPPAPATDVATIDVAFSVNEGPQIVVGDIRVIGNRRVSERTIRDLITLREGQPFGDAARRESARRLSRQGVFRLVNIDEEPRASGDTVAHVIVTVEELPATSVGYGGGLESGRQPRQTPEGTFEDRTFVAPRGFFEIGRRNLWGKNRSVDFFSRVAPRPATSTQSNFGFLEYRVSGTYREPRAFNSDADLTVGVSSEQAARTGFNFFRRTGTIQMLRRLTPEVSATGRYALEYTRLFDVDIKDIDRPVIDRLFPQVRLSILSTSLIWDRRDDAVDPSRGSLVSAEAELAARRLGSEVGYVKMFLQASAFRELRRTPRLIAATRAELGLARGFERTVQNQTVADLPVSQRFFAGGSTTVRGFQLDRLGVQPGVVTADGLSIGGNAVIVLNAELRATVGRILRRDFGVAGFTDAGNVFPRVSGIDLGQLRATVGFGVRYDSPLGPVRVDIGFKTDRQTIGGRLERGWEYHLSIGEAF